MPRLLDSVTAHGGLRHVVRITAMDETDDSGAPMMYAIQWFAGLKGQAVALPFQSGDPDRGLNGVTEHALLAVLIDRVAERTDRPMGEALHHLRHALAALNEKPEATPLRIVETMDGPAG